MSSRSVGNDSFGSFAPLDSQKKDLYLDSLDLQENTIIYNSAIGKITSTGCLTLIHCTVQEVAARHLLMIDCSYGPCKVEGHTWIYHSHLPNGGINTDRITSYAVKIILPVEINGIHLTKTMGYDLSIPAEIESVTLEDCKIDHNVICMPTNETSSIKKEVILQGDTVIGGQVIGASVLDQRLEKLLWSRLNIE
jgi:hypothetical protein